MRCFLVLHRFFCYNYSNRSDPTNKPPLPLSSRTNEIENNSTKSRLSGASQNTLSVCIYRRSCSCSRCLAYNSRLSPKKRHPIFSGACISFFLLLFLLLLLLLFSTLRLLSLSINFRSECALENTSVDEADSRYSSSSSVP